MATKPTASKSAEPQSFETAMERLEQIVAQMESENLPLEDLLKRYEEGTQLVKVCEEKLKTAEQRIEIITRNAAGAPQLAAFEPEKKAATAAHDDVTLF